MFSGARQPPQAILELEADRCGAVHIWAGSLGRNRYCFTGKGGDSTHSKTLRTLGFPSLRVAWLKQVHSTVALLAVEGASGVGDAFYTREENMALAIQTADCVPVLLSSESRIVAIHAGWRGIRSGIIASTMEKLGKAESLTAVLGPAIGPCCYEVDEEVARQIERSVRLREVVERPSRGKPHVDLQLAVRCQLESQGVAVAARSSACTRCNDDRLWSYRRDGPRAGRNVAYIWSPTIPSVDFDAGESDRYR